MPMQEIIDFLVEPYRQADAFHIILELIAVICGVLSVYFAKQENIWVYPTGIISTLIYIYICLESELYGDTIINTYYTAMSVYGWYMWSRIKDGHFLEITLAGKSDWLKAAGIFFSTAILVIAIYLINDRFDRLTDYFDTFTTGIFFAAMWLMANKKLEHWSFWIVGNIISIPLYLVKGLGFTSIQFTIFLVLAILGHIEWKKSLNNNRLIA